MALSKQQRQILALTKAAKKYPKAKAKIKQIRQAQANFNWLAQ